MKKSTNIELIIQICILAICLLVTVFIQKGIFVKAQMSCSQPPYYHQTTDVDPGHWGVTLAGSWAPNSQVNVTIDSAFNRDDVSQLKQGIEKWNGTVATQTYSNVNFNVANDTQTFDNYAVKAPQNVIWVQRTAPETEGGLLNVHIQAILRIPIA